MKLFGYKVEEVGADIFPYELGEITLQATPEELRKIAKFLIGTASRMETMGTVYSHEHLADVDNSFNDSPHFVVFSDKN